VLDHARPAVQFEALGALLSRASPTELEGELFWWRTVGGWRRLIGTAWEAHPADPGAQRTT
jgi:hypothetical protein